MTARIYLIEDSEVLALGIADNLELEGYDCKVFNHGREGVSACLDSPPDLVILDLGLPDIDGLTVLEKVRARHASLPILVLTARGSEVDVLKGFKKGANDYVVKPFSPRILLARVGAMLSGFRTLRKKLYFGEIVVDLKLMTPDGANLTTKDFQVLDLLFQSGGEPVSRITLLEEVWGMASSSSERAVDTMLSELRKKLEPDPGTPKYILTQRGIGYKLSGQAFKP